MVRVKFWYLTRMSKRYLNIAYLLIALLISYAPLLHAVDANTHLEKHLEQLQSFTADFDQRVIDIDQTKKTIHLSPQREKNSRKLRTDSEFLHILHNCA